MNACFWTTNVFLAAKDGKVEIVCQLPGRDQSPDNARHDSRKPQAFVSTIDDKYAHCNDEELHVTGEIPRPRHTLFQMIGWIEIVDIQQIAPPVPVAVVRMSFDELVPYRALAKMRNNISIAKNNKSEKS